MAMHFGGVKSASLPHAEAILAGITEQGGWAMVHASEDSSETGRSAYHCYPIKKPFTILKELRRNAEFVLSAVIQDGGCLMYASEELCGDEQAMDKVWGVGEFLMRDPVKIGHRAEVKLKDGRDVHVQTLSDYSTGLPAFLVEDLVSKEEIATIQTAALKEGMARSLTQVHKKRVTKKRAARIFKEVDADRDGALDFQELKDFLREAADVVDLNYTAFLHDQLGLPNAAEAAAAGRKLRKKEIQGINWPAFFRHASLEISTRNDIEDGGETVLFGTDLNASRSRDFYLAGEDVWSDIEAQCQSVRSCPQHPGAQPPPPFSTALVVKPRAGSALFWYNMELEPDGSISRFLWSSIHAGCPTRNTEKWASNVWLRTSAMQDEK
eukprot:s1217_g11.t1